MRLDILWEDPHGLAINKPAGLLTHAAQSPGAEPTLDALIRAYLRPENPESVYLGPVHRLDRPVSGVILWAKTPKAARRWGEQFALRQVRKEYWAVIEQTSGDLAPDQSRWDDWLANPDQSGRARVVADKTGGAARAITQVVKIAPITSRENGTLVGLNLRPETGRTHQLRAQAAARGWPIVGDATYGSGTHFEPGIALHARTLRIDHPILRTELTIQAPLPPSWSRWDLESSL